MESIRAHLATGLPNVTTLSSPKQVAGICGYGRGDYIGENRGPYVSLQQLQTDYNNTGVTLTEDGQSAVCHFGRDFFANGGKRLYVTEPAVSVLKDNTFDANGATRVFDMNADFQGGGSADALVLSPIPGTVHIESPPGTVLDYGVDWICDWSQGLIYFAVAPANDLGTTPHDITIDWREYTAAQLTTAFAVLETAPISLVGGAFFASSNGGYSLVDEIDAHCTASHTNRRTRFGFAEGYYRDRVNLIAGPGAYATEWMGVFGNRSGWFNDNLTTPSTSWKEFIDPTACIMGIASALSPQVTLHEKPMKNLNQIDEWNSTDIGLFNAAHVNYFGFDGISAFNCKDGYNIEGAIANFRYIDAARSWIYIKDRVKIAMIANNCIGSQVSRSPMIAIEQTILNELKLLHNEKVIADPAELSFAYPEFKPVMSELIEAFKSIIQERSPEEWAYIQARQADRTEPIYVFYDYQGALHYIDLYLGGL